VGALILRRGRIVLVERGREPLRGYWSLPGGVVEAGERLEEAIRREVREETGLDVEPLGVFEVFERISRDSRGRPEYHYVLIDYLCRLRGGKLKPADDVASARWVSPAELNSFQITEGTLPVIRRAFRQGRSALARSS
jgi:ADP-ribose pyrophosphatase YjhB (NUDIX family)